MKKSIKWKFTLTFILIMVCCISSILLFNSLFLEKIYINEKKDIIKKSYYALENGITESYKMGYTLKDLFKNKSRTQNSDNSESNLSRFLRELQDNYGVIAVLMDADNNTYSIFQNNNRFDKKLLSYIFKDATNDKSLEILEKTDKYTIGISNPMPVPTPQNVNNGVSAGGPGEYYESKGPSENPENPPRPRGLFSGANRNADLECFGFLSDNETAFFLTIPIASLKEPISLFNKYMVAVSLIILIIGSFIIYIVSSNLARPILRLSDLSRKMSRLEFENKYEGGSSDEIGILGNSMNEMSEKLEKSIKEIKNANIKLKKDLEKKEQLDILRQEFVANVSHELKTPIALIEGYAEGLETPGIADSEEKRNYYISVIKDETMKMNTLVHDLLDLSSLERGMEELDIERINLKELVDSVIKTYEIRIRDKGAKVISNVKDNFYIWADGYKVEQVVRNYLSNALNHVDDNLYISIDADVLESDKIRFSVFNSGVQLDDTERNKIWDKFYKVDKAHTRSYGGTGLGLSIVKAIANAHNTICGCENLDKESYKGISFYIDFNTK